MLGYLLAPLRDTLRPHFNLSKTRLATMAIILFGLANGRTVSLSLIWRINFPARRSMHRTIVACSISSNRSSLMKL